jgi:methyl-accepting chemotaxis protein
MKKIHQYFLQNQNLSYFDELKAKSYIVSLLMGLVVVLLVVLSNVLAPSANSIMGIISGLALGVLVAVHFVILKQFGFKFAGNSLSLSLMIAISISVLIVSKEIHVIYKYVQGFYSMLAFLSMSVLFSNKKVLVFNALLMAIVVTRVYLFGAENFPDDIKLIRAGFINYLAITFIISTLIFFSIRFTELAIKKASEDAQIKEKQNVQLNNMFGLVSDISEQLQVQTLKITESTAGLSNNANEHAAGLEEISATLEEITESVSANADYTNKTAQSVKRTSEFSRQNKEAINKTLEAINQVNSRIGLIQDIANKTSMLSINASIEAARAGEFGKGFSVVANEIRKLSDKSRAGAEEIELLLEETMHVSDVALSNVLSINKDIEEIEVAVQNISTANAEQKLSIDQINLSVLQLNQGSQDNANQAHKINDTLVSIKHHAAKLKAQLA